MNVLHISWVMTVNKILFIYKHKTKNSKNYQMIDIIHVKSKLDGMKKEGSLVLLEIRLFSF